MNCPAPTSPASPWKSCPTSSPGPTPATWKPEEEDIQQKLHAMHAMLWDKEMNAVAHSGLSAHYLIIRPINPLNMPSTQVAAETSTAFATLHRHGAIAAGEPGMMAGVALPDTSANTAPA